METLRFVEDGYSSLKYLQALGPIDAIRTPVKTNTRRRVNFAGVEFGRFGSALLGNGGKSALDCWISFILDCSAESGVVGK